MKTLSQQQRVAEGPPTQAAYEKIVDALATLRMQKVLSYGEARYKDTDPTHAFGLLYADIYRKFIRIQNAIGPGKPPGSYDTAVEALRDTLLDLANYGIMGVQLLESFSKAQESTFAQPTLLPSEPITHEEFNVPSTTFMGVLDQIAFFIPEGSREKAEELYAFLFGARDWNRDNVVAEGRVASKVFGVNQGQNAARLNFNYEMIKGGLEFEVLNYDSGPNYLEEEVGPALAHLATHVEDIESAHKWLVSNGFEVVQDVRTISHSNPAVPAERRYRYAIYDTRSVLGFRLKLIQRLTVCSDE